MSKHIRTVYLRPYRPGCGPVVSLRMEDSGRTDSRGCTVIDYRLKSGGTTIFEGTDYSPGVGTSDDSDESVEGLIGFLTLQPGDTDADYFRDHTPAQFEWLAHHAEAVGMESEMRFITKESSI